MRSISGLSAALALLAAFAGEVAAQGPSFVEPPASATSLAASRPQPDPCLLPEIASSPTRPNWDTSAQTTQCGVVEIDSGWMTQPLGAGVRQSMWMSSLRYGLTPRLDLRWAMTSRMWQSSAGLDSIGGAGDGWLTARYRFLDQARVRPAMAVAYAVKIPAASPAKGFGSGFVDNQFTLIASRDFGRSHFDFNLVGTQVGGPRGSDGAAQFGLALTRPATRKLSWILESYGGPQPGTSDRFGAALGGVSWLARPTLALDAAYSRAYTAGSPRAQYIFGITYAMRPFFPPIPRGSAIARVLGR